MLGSMSAPTSEDPALTQARQAARAAYLQSQTLQARMEVEGTDAWLHAIAEQDKHAVPAAAGRLLLRIREKGRLEQQANIVSMS